VTTLITPTRTRTTAPPRQRTAAPSRPASRPAAPATVRPISTPPATTVQRPSADAPRAPFVLLVLALAAAGLVAMVLLNTAINENAFRLHDLDKRQKALDATEQRLERDVAELEAPGSLLAAAKRLGLVPAGQQAYIELPSGKVLGVATPAKAPAAVVAKPPAKAPAPVVATPSKAAVPGTRR